MRTIISLTMICAALWIGLMGCGDSGGKDDEDTSGSAATPAFTYSKADDLKTPFYCSGGTVSFEIKHTGTCAYRFDLIRKDTQQIWRNLVTGTGDLDVKTNATLDKGDYLLGVTTTCTWSVGLYGPVVQYVSYILCGKYIGTPDSNACEDHGGVSGIIGCDRNSGYFICADGTQSASKCGCQ